MGDLQQIYTSVQWTSVNPVLQAGQIGRESDTGLSKEGDGVTAYLALPYGVPPPAAAGVIYVPGIVADATGPGSTGTDNWAALNASFAGPLATAPNMAIPLPPGIIGVSQPVLLPLGQRLPGSGSGVPNGDPHTNPTYGTTIVPLSTWNSPQVGLDTAGGTIAAASRQYTYTSSATTTLNKFATGQIVTVTGGSGAVPTNCTIVDVELNGPGGTLVLTLTAGCTAGTVTSIQSSWNSVVVGAHTLNGTQQLDIDAGTVAARALTLTGSDCKVWQCNFHGGTLASFDNLGDRLDMNTVRTDNTANVATSYQTYNGPFSFRTGLGSTGNPNGADQQYTSCRFTNGTTQLNGEGQMANVHFSKGTAGGPTVDQSGGGNGSGNWFIDVVTFDANSGGTSNCAIHRNPGSGGLYVTTAYVNAGPDGASVPFIIDDTTTGVLFFNNIEFQATSASPATHWTCLASFTNGAPGRPSLWVMTNIQLGSNAFDSNTAPTLWIGLGAAQGPYLSNVTVSSTALPAQGPGNYQSWQGTPGSVDITVGSSLTTVTTTPTLQPGTYLVTGGVTFESGAANLVGDIEMTVPTSANYTLVGNYSGAATTTSNATQTKETSHISLSFVVVVTTASVLNFQAISTAATHPIAKFQSPANSYNGTCGGIIWQVA